MCIMKYKWIIVCFSLFFLVLPCSKVYAAKTFESNYNYDYWGNVNKSIPAFEYYNTLDSSNMMNGLKISSVDDVFVGKDRIFIVDSAESRVDIFDTNLKFITSIKLIRNSEGRIVVNPDTNVQLMLTKPEGVFYSEVEDELYIADTGAGRIIVLDGKSYYYKRTIEKPKNMVGATQFKPSKIVVNKDGKISAVVQGSYEGIIEINRDGSFSRYFGLNKPKVNIVDYFWKSIASNQQKEKMKKSFAPAFNNLDIDADGLIYATTYDASAKDMVFRFNSKGENVLQSKGYLPVTGDPYTPPADTSTKSSSSNNDGQTKFVDIAVSDYGVYALLDKTKGRVFIYDFQGDLLSIFNSIGNLKGNVKEASGISWFGDKLIIADKQLGSCMIFQPTEFGEAALGAAKEYFNGNWQEAGKLFKETLKLNTNYDIAYTGVGRDYLMQDKYKDALYYFKLGNSKEYFSKAFAGFRNLVIQKNFNWFVVLFLILAAALFYSEYKYNKSNK